MQTEQICREYKIRALLLHPDKNKNIEKSLEEFKRLQTAKDVLTDPSLRKSYDTWLNSGINIPFEQWQTRKGHSMHWASPRQTKLSIQNSDIGQGSDPLQKNEISRFDTKTKHMYNNNDWLDKFRKYEI